MNKTIQTITQKFKNKVNEIFPTAEIILFGSTARGDNHKESDIDLMVKLPRVNRGFEEQIYNLAYDLELEYDCIIDVFILPLNSKFQLPIHQNIAKEGIII